MIDYEPLKARAEGMLDVCMKLLGVSDFSVYFKFAGMDKSAASIRLDQAYLFGEVKFDLHACTDEYEALSLALHECVHIAMHPLDSHHQVMRELIPAKSRKAMKKSYTIADEQVTVRMTAALLPLARERYDEWLDNQGLDPIGAGSE